MEENLKYQGDERRKFVRLNAAVDVQYTVLKRDSAAQKKVQSRNISAGGICIIAYEEIPIGTTLALTIYFPNEAFPIMCKGKVAWAKPFKLADEEKERYDIGVGIEFFEINEEDRKKIHSGVFKYKK
ncbi:PilZ domain-containing protein [Candidatus Omnitrophota bacterium]